MVPLEASRKHYEQACGDLIKAQVSPRQAASSCERAELLVHHRPPIRTAQSVSESGQQERLLRLMLCACAGVPAEGGRQKGTGRGGGAGRRHHREGGPPAGCAQQCTGSRLLLDRVPPDQLHRALITMRRWPATPTGTECTECRWLVLGWSERTLASIACSCSRLHGCGSLQRK